MIFHFLVAACFLWFCLFRPPPFFFVLFFSFSSSPDLPPLHSISFPFLASSLAN